MLLKLGSNSVDRVGTHYVAWCTNVAKYRPYTRPSASHEIICIHVYVWTEIWSIAIFSGHCSCTIKGSSLHGIICSERSLEYKMRAESGWLTWWLQHLLLCRLFWPWRGLSVVWRGAEGGSIAPGVYLPPHRVRLMCGSGNCLEVFESYMFVRSFIEPSPQSSNVPIKPTQPSRHPDLRFIKNQLNHRPRSSLEGLNKSYDSSRRERDNAGDKKEREYGRRKQSTDGWGRKGRKGN